MFTDIFEITAGWDLREESVEACAGRMSQMLETLAAVHPTFTRIHWMGVGKAVPTRDMQHLRALELLEGLFDRHRVFDEAQRRWMADGFRLSAYSQLDGRKCVAVTVKVGRDLEHRYSARFANSVTLAITGLGPLAQGGMPPETIEPIVRALTEAWSPEFCGAYSALFGIRCKPGLWPRPFYAGAWMIYLCSALAERITVAADTIAATVHEGLLLRATDGVFDLANPKHIRAADAIQTALSPFESWSRGF